MKNLLLIILLLISFSSFSQTTNKLSSTDKQIHLYVGTSIGIILTDKIKNKSNFERILIATSTTTALAFSKEFYDKSKGGTIMKYDIIYTVSGGLIGSSLNILSEKIFTKKKNKKQVFIIK